MNKEIDFPKKCGAASVGEYNRVILYYQLSWWHKFANVKSWKDFLKCSGRFLFSRSFLRLLLKRPSRVALAHVLLVPGYQAVCRWSTADQGGDKNRSTSNSPCFSLVVVICIAVWETPFYGMMQAGQKLGIVYIGKAGGKVCAETFRLVSFTYLYLIWSRTTSWFVILQFNLLMFSWSVISVVS